MTDIDRDPSRAVLEVRGVSKSFGSTRALVGVSVDIRPGEVLCLVGENGAGKSTLGKVVAGFERPDAGELTFGGEPLGRLTPRVAIDHGIAIVPQATVPQELRQGTLAVVPFRGKEFTRPLAILHRKGRVLTRIDVQATFKEKLGVAFPRYVILGACNPGFAHRALTAEPAAGLLLPCNVTLSEDGLGVLVRIVDPTQTMASALSPELSGLAAEVREKLVRVHERL